MLRRAFKSLMVAFLALPAFIILVNLNFKAAINYKNDVRHKELSMSDRINLLRKVCDRSKDPFRAENLALTAEPNKVGVEVVYLRSGSQSQKPMFSVCIPHKVGSHAWGRFASLKEFTLDQSELDLPWKIKAQLSHRVVVVRHPLERLLSVYRMIFEDWCDEKRFLALQWNNVCVTDVDPNEGQGFIDEAAEAKKFSAIKFLYSMADEQRHGNDRYIQKIWRKFNPGVKLVDPKSQLKFTFSQFVRFIVNGSVEFDQDVLRHKGLSYHWAPYWQECSLCSNDTRPDVIIHMETFREDLERTLRLSGYQQPEELSDLMEKFPHTHSQSGGHSHDLVRKYFSQLSQNEVYSLYEMYRLDHVMFGYSPDEYLSYAKPS